MKYFLSVFTFLCFSYGSDLLATPKYVYNHGYVIGELNTVDFLGPNRRIVTGQVSIGNNSFNGDNGFREELRGNYVLNNPWNFCGDQDIYEQLINHIGEFVVDYY